MRWNRTRLAVAAVCLTIFAATAAAAQPITIPRFDFSFSNPGARSLGFAGAFAALADDATAAYANPAGLVQLTKPEASIEVRLWNRSPSFWAGGRVEGTPTGQGLDTHDGIVTGRDHSQTIGPSFASIVIPKGRWSFALYGHQLANFRERSTSQGFFFTVFDPEDETTFSGRVSGSKESVSLDVATVGAAAGWRMNDHLSFGLGLVYSDVALKTRSDAYSPDDDSPQAQFGTISFLPQRLFSTSTLSAEGTDVTVNAGALWRMTEQLSAGLFYRQGAKVHGTFEISTGPVIPVQETFRNGAVFKIPDIAGAALAYRSPGGRVTLAGEVDHVGYSGLIKVNDDGGFSSNRDYFNAWEYHVGGEYALLRTTPILALRAGYWVEANGDDQLKRRFDHFTAGLGIAAPAFQIDLAGDLSDEGNRFSASVIYDF
jgi:long-subunit fatty acid transport protein